MSRATASLDSVFSALANPTRRAVVERLRRGPTPVSELAAPFGMALPSFMQHLGVLEASGLVKSTKHGRVRVVRVIPARLASAATWLAEQQALWERRLDQFDASVTSLEKSR